MFATPWGSQLGASRDPLFTQLPETERHAAVEFCFCDLKQKKTKLFDSDLRAPKPEFACSCVREPSGVALAPHSSHVLSSSDA